MKAKHFLFTLSFIVLGTAKATVKSAPLTVDKERIIYAEPIKVTKTYYLSSIDSKEASTIFETWGQSKYQGISNAFKVVLNYQTVAIAGILKFENGMQKAACFKRNGMALFEKGVEGTDLESIKQVLVDRCLVGVD
ncbi:MAG: hypothetical protein ACXVCY_15200 [Pseudobdellovibrionaceae bacterium]